VKQQTDIAASLPRRTGRAPKKKTGNSATPPVKSSKQKSAQADKAASSPGTRPARKKRTETERNGERTRAIILEHAARLLRENGYAAVSLRQIAAEANIKAGSIYYHFSSKEEILYHVLEEGLRVIVQEVNEAIAKLPPDASFRDRLQTVIKSHLHGLLRVGDYSSANIRIYGQVPPEVRKRHYVSRREFADWWDRFLMQAKEEGALRKDLNLSVVRVFVVGALNWTVEWYDPKRGSFDEVADQIYRIIADGLSIG